MIPNVRFRRDIGAKLVAGDFARVERLGLLDPRVGQAVFGSNPSHPATKAR